MIITLPANTLGGIEYQLAYFNLLSSKYLSDFEKEEMGPLWEIADEKKFFHWEIEFSEVFQKGGFDIAIGNPPYVGCIKTRLPLFFITFSRYNKSVFLYDR